MKNHIISLFDPMHRLWTLSFFLASALLIIASQIVGISDNIPGFAMFFIGVISFFFSLLHPWRKSKNYVMLIWICSGLILLEFLVITIFSALHLERYLSEAVFLGFFGIICIPGIVTGIIGKIFWSKRGK